MQHGKKSSQNSLYSLAEIDHGYNFKDGGREKGKGKVNFSWKWKINKDFEDSTAT